MNVSAFLMSLFGAVLIGQGLWMLTVRPDPPAGTTGPTTRRGRQIVAIGAVILGVFALAVKASQIFSGA